VPSGRRQQDPAAGISNWERKRHPDYCYTPGWDFSPHDSGLPHDSRMNWPSSFGTASPARGAGALPFYCILRKSYEAGPDKHWNRRNSLGSGVVPAIRSVLAAFGFNRYKTPQTGMHVAERLF
jgi:hypothetical protein